MKFDWAIFAVLVAWTAGLAHAAPPRVLDDEEPIRQANFADVEAPELPRTITPRSKPAAVSSDAKSTSKQTAASTSLWGTVVGLGVVFVLFLGARVWLTKHGPAGLRGLPVEALELLGKRTIEPRVSIHLVRCGPKILVLGVSPDGVRTLTEIADPVEIDLISGACRRKEPSGKIPPSFASMFPQTEVSNSSRGGTR